MEEILQMANTFWPFLILIAVFYFFMYRPQKKEEHRRRVFLDSLKKGAHVVTAGGLHGVIRALREDTVLLEIAPKVQLHVERSAIQKFAEKSAALKPEKDEPKEEPKEELKEEPETVETVSVTPEAPKTDVTEERK